MHECDMYECECVGQEIHAVGSKYRVSTGRNYGR